MLQSGYDPVLYGKYLEIHGEGGHRSYFYAHMPRPAAVKKGERVWEGELVGAVGETGNAAHGRLHAPLRDPRQRCRDQPGAVARALGSLLA